MTKQKNKFYEVLKGKLKFDFGKTVVVEGDAVELGQADIDNGYDIDSLVANGFLKEIRKPRKKKQTEEDKE